MHATPRPGPATGATTAAPTPAPTLAPTPGPDARMRGEEGSLVTEYGLIAVLGATIAGIAIKWASGGAIFELLGALLRKVRAIVGA